jgi:site-specific recombinase XerD
MNSAQALEALRAALRRQQCSPATERTYCGWLARYIHFLRSAPSAESREKKVEAFLTDLAMRRRSASSQNQALNALVFFHAHVLEQPLSGVDALRARRPQRVRVAPARHVTRAFIEALGDTPAQPIRLVARLLYGCGLRVSEALNLRLKDVDLHGRRIWIRDAKHHKDRVVALPRTLIDALADQMAHAEALWREDFRARVPVPLPGLLRNKLPHAEYSRDWRWLFPAANVCTDARQGRTVRWRCHEAIVQKEFSRTSAWLRLCPALTPHHLRHAYATHCLEDGVNIRALQAAMGHNSLETTMTYLHADPLSVASPLDTWAASQPQSAFLRAEPQR